ncbi:PD-(D/E)XK nuclease family protein [Nocardia sp. NPDC055321]
MEDFTFAPMMGGLDLIEHDGWSQADAIAELMRTKGKFDSNRAPAHPSLLEWTVQAIPRYLAAREAEQAEREGSVPQTIPIRFEWAALYDRNGDPDSRGATRYERSVWGRRYGSADGSVRDIWLPSIKRARSNRSEAEKAAVAGVLATGEVCPRPGFERPYRPLRIQPPLRPVRVRAFGYGCGDNKVVPILDWDQDEVRRRYREYAAPAFARAVAGSAAVPGSSCIKCKALAGCVTLPRTQGLWGGIPGEIRRPRRSLSAWDLRLYGQCPARYHLVRQLNLTSMRPEPVSAVRGRAVDARLNDQHRSRPVGGCRTVASPPDPDNWSADGVELTGQAARDGAAMLAQHAWLCPVDGSKSNERFLVQHQLSCYIPELDVVVIATPDLLYTRSGGWVWRETKTAGGRLWEGRSLLQNYPQLALGVLLLAAGVLGGELRRSRVELEVLYRDDGTLEVLDPSRSAVVDEARDVIAGLADPLLRDDSYNPVPGRHCHDCEARPWCRTGREFIDRNPLPEEQLPRPDDVS